MDAVYLVISFIDFNRCYATCRHLADLYKVHLYTERGAVNAKIYGQGQGHFWTSFIQELKIILIKRI